MEKYNRDDIYNQIDYIQIMIKACVLHIKDVEVYYDIEGSYEGTINMKITGVYKNKKVELSYRQDYGSCSYCDWLQAVGEEEVFKHYKKEINHLLDELEG